MKKAISIALILAVCFSFFACSKKAEDTETTSTTALTTTTEPVTSTTAPAKEDEEKGEELKETVLSSVGESTDGSITGELKYGSFTYIFNRNPSVVYANERSQEFEDKATANAEKLVDAIKSFYGDEITFDRMYPYEIGGGDNGTDSVRYEFYYLNSQNQQLKIYADSDGVISFAECKFTW